MGEQLEGEHKRAPTSTRPLTSLVLLSLLLLFGKQQQGRVEAASWRQCKSPASSAASGYIERALGESKQPPAMNLERQGE